MMLKETSPDAVQLTLTLQQLKVLYRALFAQLHAGLAAIDDLDDDDMLLTLQQYLQRRAAAAGVDCTVHADWEAFLGVVGAASCEARFANRPRPEAG